MSAKRALVVDDSKSARAFLARILERHEIAVDAAESAEAAIEYLARHKPDVIFMDHMMPGMDGFQAVQSIKNNPRTSAIPILMYTSQEGDLYLGQARALGAEGVLPKQIKQADVTRVLYQLDLVADRRAGDRTTFARMAQGPDLLPANESAIVVTPRFEPACDAPGPGPAPAEADVARLLPQLSLEIRAALDGSLQKELTAFRSFLAATLDSHTERLHGELLAAAAPARAPEPEAATLIPERRSWSTVAGWSVALLALAGAALISWTWWQQGAEVAALRSDLAAAYTELETLRARPAVVSPAPTPPVTDTAVAIAATMAMDMLPAGESGATGAGASEADAAAPAAAVEPPPGPQAAAAPASRAQ